MQYALLVGIQSVDPRKFNGWNGIHGCEGVPNDLKAMSGTLASKGFLPNNMLTLQARAATREAVLDQLDNFANKCKAGDIFVFYFSGHGSQMRDRSGEEADGLDEVKVVYDGILVDDAIYTALEAFERNVRIVMLSDCCHSGEDINYKPAKLTPRREDRDIKALVIEIGASRAAETAAGFEQGGAFTLTLCRLLAEGFVGNYQQLTGAIYKRTSRAALPQHAVYEESGRITATAFERFRISPIFRDINPPNFVPQQLSVWGKATQPQPVVRQSGCCLKCW